MIKERANKILYNVKNEKPIDDDKPILKDNEEEEK